MWPRPAWRPAVRRDRNALRAEVEAALLAELERVGPAALSKAVLVRRFDGRGASRATLYRWLDDLLQSGKAGQHLAGKIKQAAQERAGSTVDPAADAARETAMKLPPVIGLDDVAPIGGTIAFIAKLHAAIAAAEQVMCHARTEDGRVRNGRMLLAAAESLRRSLDTAVHLQRAILELTEIERFHRAIFEEIARESPELAERVVTCLRHLSNQWTPAS
jgi:hypothetical protein